MTISVSKSAIQRNGSSTLWPIMAIADADRFRLEDDFVSQFEGRDPEWGPVGKITYKRTYARPLPGGGTEEWPQTLTRIVNGVYTVQKWHCRNHNLPWSDSKAQRSAQQMFRLMWDFKFLPGGRGLWMMGTPYVEQSGSACLNNCSFTTTANIDKDFSEPFCFLMDFSMLGVGVGGDCRGAGKVIIQRPIQGEDAHVVADSRQGWVELVRRFLDAYVGLSTIPAQVDYSKVRPAGSPVRGFGGTASGPDPLKRLVNEIQRVLDNLIDRPITSEAIVDLFDLIGVCVVAGNIRRSAIIMFGDPDDDAYLNLKNPETSKAEMMTHRWASNNSITASVGMDYAKSSEITQKAGEPGFIWLENARKYGRFGHHLSDNRVMGTNPCVTGDTLVATADGRLAVPIKDLVDAGKDVPVYSVDVTTGEVRIKLGIHPRWTGRKPVYRVTLDDGSSFKATDNHKLLRRDLDKVAVCDLKPGDSLRNFTRFKYPMGLTPGDYWHIVGGRLSKTNAVVTRPEHQLIASYYLGRSLSEDEMVHHKDEDRLNNKPENLEITDPKHHADDHDFKTAFSGDGNPNWCGKANDELIEVGAELASSLGRSFTLDEWKAFAAPKKLPTMLLSESRFDSFRDFAIRCAKRAGVATNRSREGLLMGTFVNKVCEGCSIEFVVPYGKRERCYCSIACHNEHVLAKDEKRIENQRRVMSRKSEKTKQAMIEVYVKLAEMLGREPRKSEWETECKSQGVSRRFHKNTFSGFKELKLAASVNNHKVVSVEYCGEEDVYNITVEDDHNFAIVTNTDYRTKKDLAGQTGIFSAQCGEISLEPAELCNLVESFPARHDSYEDYERTLKYAYLYAKAVSLIPTHNSKTNAVMLRNRRIGVSQSGIVQSFKRHGRRTHFNWCHRGYAYLRRLDDIYSEWLCVRKSIRITTVKPAGTTSLLPGATPGIHYEHSRYYYRTIRVAKTSPLVEEHRRAGYKVEDDMYDQSGNTAVIYFPIEAKFFDRAKHEVSIWEQLENAAQMQQFWSDNSVSVTVSFKESEAKDIVRALELYESRLKTVSFLPLKHEYPQAPYIAISEEEYNKAKRLLREADLSESSHEVTVKYCDGDRCELPVSDDLSDTI